MVSPLHSSSLNPYSLPFFIPLHFACRRRPNPFYLFVPFSIAMFSGLDFTPFFYLLFFGLFGGNFIRMSFTLCYRILRVISSICCLFCLTLQLNSYRKHPLMKTSKGAVVSYHASGLVLKGAAGRPFFPKRVTSP